MESPRALQPCRLSANMLGVPLPFDLYNGKGILLVRQGTKLDADSDHFQNQLLYRTRDGSEDMTRLSLERLESLYGNYVQLMDAWRCSVEDVHQLRLQAGDLVHLCGSHSELCVAAASHLPGKHHSTRHSFATAIVAILLGDALGWHLHRQHSLARAALTMNLALLPLHDRWAKHRERLSDAERGNVRRHPTLSAELLVQSPGVDLSWVAAVDQHHENLDGSGYPLGLQGAEICPEARVLRVADAWCALVLLRAGKARKTPKDAMQEMGRFVGTHFDAQVFQALKRLMGAYPPGTFVRLANRETAIVVRWDKQGALPKYATSVLLPSGQKPREFKLRTLSQRDYGIRDYTHLDLSQMAHFSVAQVFASGAA